MLVSLSCVIFSLFLVVCIASKWLSGSEFQTPGGSGKSGSLVSPSVAWTLRFIGAPRKVGRSELWGLSFWMNMEATVLHFIGPSISRGAASTCQVKQFSFGEKSATKPPKASLQTFPD